MAVRIEGLRTFIIGFGQRQGVSISRGFISIRLVDTPRQEASDGACEAAGADEAPMSDRARDVWVEHLITTYMDMSQPDWNHL